MRACLLALLLSMSVFAAPAVADVKPARLFSDHAVLQQGVAVPVWGTADAGERVTVSLGDQKHSTTADDKGHWVVRLDPLQAGGPMEMTVAGKNTVRIADLYAGEVWLCSGQSNMDMRIAKTKERYWCGVNNEAEELAAANYPQMRMFVTDFKLADEPQTDVTGDWKVTTPQNAPDFSATAYFFGRELHKTLKVPVGLVVSSYGASTAQAWISREAIAAQPQLAPMLEEYAKACRDFESGAAQAKYQQALKDWDAASAKAKADGKPAPKKPGAPKDPHKDQHNPCVLYNGMIAPVIPYAIKGAIWYQGESNGVDSYRYLPLMKTLIADWRGRWGEREFPFDFVQLAAIGTPTGTSTARVRDAQLKTLDAVPNTAMAVTIDIGEAKNVHPKNKQEAGRRLALPALALAYGQKIPYSGPLFERMMILGNGIDGDSIRIHFTHTDGGLVAKGGSLTGFAIASADGKFVPAEATIDDDTILLHSKDVPQPTKVRYAFADFPTCNLYNGAGLPASPFNIDADEAATEPSTGSH